MERLRLAAAPLFFAYRRIGARPLSFAAIVAALGGAVALIGWSSLTAADAQETSVRARLGELPPGRRALQVVYFVLPGEADFRAEPVADAVAGFRDVTTAPQLVRISHSINRIIRSGRGWLSWTTRTATSSFAPAGCRPVAARRSR